MIFVLVKTFRSLDDTIMSSLVNITVKKWSEGADGMPRSFWVQEKNHFVEL